MDAEIHLHVHIPGILAEPCKSETSCLSGLAAISFEHLYWLGSWYRLDLLTMLQPELILSFSKFAKRYDMSIGRYLINMGNIAVQFSSMKRMSAKPFL